MNPPQGIQASNPESPSHLPLHIISLDHPHAPAASILYPVSNINDTPFLQLFLKFSLCRVSLAVGLSLLAVGGLLTAVLLLLPTSGLVPCLGLELLCALSQGLLLPGLSKKSSLSPGGPRAEVRRERDLPLQLRACLSAVPSAQGGAELSAPARWKAGPPWSTPGMLGSFNGPEPGGPESTIRK